METSLIFEPQNLTKETIKKYLCPSASDQELMMGLQIAKTFNLNPLKREVYFVKYGNSPMSILTGYEVYLKRAERSNKWNGMEVSSIGTIKDGDLRAVVKIYRKDWEYPLVHEVYYSEYVQTKTDGSPNRFWATKPITMIKKVGVSQALRLAFPEEFDGMPYTSDEVVDQEKIVDIKVDETKNHPYLHDTIQEVVPQLELPPELKEFMELAHKAFEGSKLRFVQWLELNYGTTKPENLNKEKLEIAKNFLLDVIAKKEESK